MHGRPVGDSDFRGDGPDVRPTRALGPPDRLHDAGGVELECLAPLQPAHRHATNRRRRGLADVLVVWVVGRAVRHQHVLVQSYVADIVERRG